MDCWFWLEEKNGDYYVIDLENGNKKMALSTAVKQMHEGIVDARLYALSETEAAAVNQLFACLGLDEIDFRIGIEVIINCCT